MARIRATVSIPRDTNLPEDVATNTFHFGTNPGPPSPENLNTIFNALVTLYGVLDNRLSSLVGSLATVRFYDLFQPKPRVPLRESTFPLTPSAGTPYPEEVALTLSFRGDPTPGVPAARRRGRIFLGPIATIGDIVAGRLQPSAATRTELTNAMKAFALALAPEDAVKWCVYSPTDDAMVPVTNGWVDNAFDTMRSRGPAATERTTWTILP